MLEMSWITAILWLYSQVTDIFGNVIVKRINIRLFDLLALFHYILNLPRILLYADDIVLMAQNAEELQKMINALHEWTIKWRLSVNT